MTRKKLGEIFLERGIIDQDQLNAALAYQRQWGHRLGTALVAKGFITEGMLAKVLGEVMSLPVVDLSQAQINGEALRLVPYQTCENNDLIPIDLQQQGHSRIMTIAMSDPMNIAVIDEIEFTTGCKVRPVLATISAIQSAIRKYYRGQNTNIKPLSLYHAQHRDTGKMVLVRPGGEMEQVDTSTYQEARKRADRDAEPDSRQVRDKVAEIKARRAARVGNRAGAISSDEAMEDYLKEVQTGEWETLQKLEKYFWALMRVMARKGLVTKEEFLRELKD